jgi:hypothetical protein
MHLKSLVKRNIELAQVRQNEVLNSDVASFRYWEGYINALESIVHVLPDDKESSEEELQIRQISTKRNKTSSSKRPRKNLRAV